MTYTIAGGDSFNMVLSHVDRSDPQTWTQETVIPEMRACFNDWDPRSVVCQYRIHLNTADSIKPDS
jgi:salicylate hydroxylase